MGNFCRISKLIHKGKIYEIGYDRLSQAPYNHITVDKFWL